MVNIHAGLALGLGSSWLIVNIFYTYPKPVKLSSHGIKMAVVMLACTFVGIIISMWANKWVLTKYHAYAYMSWYAVFIVGTIAGMFDDAKIPVLEYDDRPNTLQSLIQMFG